MIKQMFKLKQCSYQTPESLKLFKITEKAIEIFNIYVMDFFESLNILNESLVLSKSNKNKKNTSEIKNNIIFIENKISALYSEMYQIEKDMVSFVEIVTKP